MRGIRKQGKDSYRITVSLGMDPYEGEYKKHQETVKGTRKDAEKRKTELMNLKNKGFIINPEKITFSELLDRWLRDYCSINTSRRTYHDYTTIINNHIRPELGHIPLAKLHPSHLVQLYSKLLREGRKDNKKTANKGLSPSTVKHVHVVINEALSHAVKWELVHRNVADAVDPPKVVREEAPCLSEEQVKSLLNFIKGTYLYLPAYIAICTGMRLGEILGLTWEDIDLDNGVIRVRRAQKVLKGSSGYVNEYGPPKSKNSNRSVDIPEGLVKHLKSQISQQEGNKKWLGAMGVTYEDNDLVCCREDGRPFKTQSFSSYFSKKAKEAGFPVSFHALRHTHASLLLKNKESLKLISARLGHSGIGITGDTYAHLYPDAQKEAAQKIGTILDE